MSTQTLIAKKLLVHQKQGTGKNEVTLFLIVTKVKRVQKVLTQTLIAKKLLLVQKLGIEKSEVTLFLIVTKV